MQDRLRAQGIRPINNLVDITNYVMEEMGQPMHAFDLSTIAGNKIVVRRAIDGEKFTTLDGQERVVDSNTLMICDAEKEIGIAGMMGGQNSMVTDDIQTLLFEGLLHLTEQTFVFQRDVLAFVQMPLVSSKRVLIQTLLRKQWTVHVS